MSEECRNTTVILYACEECANARRASGCPRRYPYFQEFAFSTTSRSVGLRASLAPGLPRVSINNKCVRARGCVYVCVHVPPKLSSTSRASDAFVNRRRMRARARAQTRRSACIRAYAWPAWRPRDVRRPREQSNRTKSHVSLENYVYTIFIADTQTLGDTQLFQTFTRQGSESTSTRGSGRTT